MIAALFAALPLLTIAAPSFPGPRALLSQPVATEPTAQNPAAQNPAPAPQNPAAPTPGAQNPPPQNPGAPKPAPPPAGQPQAGKPPAGQPQAGPPPAGAGGAQSGAGKIPPIQENGEFYELYFEETTEGEAGLTLEQFVKLCEDATGINFTYSDTTAGQLKQAKLRMFGRKTIPKSDFYSFFQIMMIINEFVCTKIGPDHLAVVLIQSSAQGNRGGAGTLKKDAVYVAPEDLERYADQPAVLIHTVVDLPHVDARQLSTSLRQMFPDQQTQSILPVSGTSLILTGFGSDVAAMVRMLQFVDKAAQDQAVVLPDFEMIPLEFASAEEVADTLTDLLEASRRAAQARGAQVAQAQGATGQLQTGQTESKIMVDARTNSLLVMAMPDDMPRIKELVARLDVDIVQGERTYHIYNLENVDAEELSDTLDSFIRDASRVTPGGPTRAQGQGGAQGGGGGASSSQRNEIVVVADKATNSLLIAANRTRYEEVLDLIRRLDQRQDQVLIETALIELSGQDTFQLAVELGLAEISGAGDGGFGVSSFGLSTFEDTNGDGVPDVRMPNLFGGAAPPGLTAGIIRGDDFSLPILINALQTRRDTNVLNVPSVLVNNNKSAKVVSKDEQPTTTITATGGVSGQTQENFKEYVEAGITLEISPTISASRYLRLNISLEVSTFIGAVNGAIPPPKVTRTINTQVNVPDGDTMVVGGIITDNLGHSKTSVPWLGDIPILGYLFSDTSESQSKTTLYFFVTPHIMRDRDFADLAEYSFKRKLEAADTIGADRIRVVDPTFGRDKEGVDMRGFEVPLYRGPERGEVQDGDVGLDAKKLNEMLEQGESSKTPPAAPVQPVPVEPPPDEKP